MPCTDLTHPVEDGMQTYPGDPPVSLTAAATMANDGARVTGLSLGSHAGTHVDAPAHTEPDGRTLGTFDLSAFVFEARLVDATGLGERAAIGLDALPERVAAPDLDCLVFHTGWDADWGTDHYRDHPYLAPETAAWCAERGLAVGLDTLGPDPTPSADAAPGSDAGADVGSDIGADTGDAANTAATDGFPAHHALLGADCLVVENLTGLDAVPERFTLRAYPLALDADGAPVRAVAAW